MALIEVLEGIHKQIRRHNKAQKRDKPIPNHEKNGNLSEIASVLVNSILAFLTIAAIWISYRANQDAKQANQTSKDALNYAKYKDSMDNIEQKRKDKIEEDERVFNRRFVDTTLFVSNQGVEAAKKASLISEKALSETRKSYEFSRESAIKELRAYVLLHKADVTNITMDSIARLQMDFKNVGKTPAYKVRIIIQMQVIATYEIDRVLPNFIGLMEKGLDTAITTNLGAEQSTSFILNSKERFTKANVQSIESGATQIFIGGNIIYHDAFDKKHFTHMLGVYNPKLKTFIAYKKYNEIK